MIRSLGFLTGMVVTGTAVWALSDGVAAKAALDSLSAYLAEGDAAAESGPAAEETDRRILPPAAIMSGKADASTTPAATRAASLEEAVTKQDQAKTPVPGPEALGTSVPNRTEVLARADPAGSSPDVARVTETTGAGEIAGPDTTASMVVSGADGEPGGIQSGDTRTPVPEDDPQEPEITEIAETAPAAPVREDEPIPAQEPEQDADGNWFAFWTPFRSRASAEGFARHLTQATGQDIQVLRIGPGEYRVAFSHQGEEDRRRHLASLESASGLELGGEL